MVFPPTDVVESPAMITMFLRRHNHPLKILLLILAARRRRIRHLPAEIWELVYTELINMEF